MANPPVSPQLSHRLDQLTQDIRCSLAQVRRHIQELEQVEQADLAPGQGGQGFSTLLKSALSEAGTSPTQGPRSSSSATTTG
jgi:hypothetical protein